MERSWNITILFSIFLEVYVDVSFPFINALMLNVLLKQRNISAGQLPLKITST